MNIRAASAMPASLLAMAIMYAVPMAAQVDSVHLRNQCRLAAQVIATGHPAPQDGWALQTIRSCGMDGADAVASGLRSLRGAAYGPDMAALFKLTFWFQDARVYAIAADIAQDPAASLPARILAMRTLVWQIEAQPLAGGEYSALATGAPYDGRYKCPGIQVIDAVRFVGRALPQTYLADAEKLGLLFQRDTTLAPDLRRMGACLSMTARFEGGMR